MFPVAQTENLGPKGGEERRSQCALPERFLRGGHVPEPFRWFRLSAQTLKHPRDRDSNSVQDGPLGVFWRRVKTVSW